MLPGMDVCSLYCKLREKLDIPILMVTARRADIDKIRGLGLGADDDIETPLGVWVARFKANLAQYSHLLGAKKPPPEIMLGEIRLNIGTHRVCVKGQEIELKNKEYALLIFLILHVHMVFDQEMLYKKV